MAFAEYLEGFQNSKDEKEESSDLIVRVITFFSDLASQINRFIWLAVFIFVSGQGHRKSGSGSRLVELQFIREIQFSQAWWNLVRLSLIVHQARMDIAPLSTQIKPSLKNNSELLLTDI